MAADSKVAHFTGHPSFLALAVPDRIIKVNALKLCKIYVYVHITTKNVLVRNVSNAIKPIIQCYI